MHRASDRNYCRVVRRLHHIRHNERACRWLARRHNEGAMVMKANIRTLLVAGAIAAATMVVPPLNAAEIKTGGTLTYTFQPEPPALSTIATTAVPVAIASTKIFESLLEYSGKELTPKPGLAESWTLSL